MKIFSSSQINNWDSVSIKKENIPSFQLMERAATACYHWLVKKYFIQKPIMLFCGKGNNGGDGLALARMLLQNNVPVSIYILESGKNGSYDFQMNLQQLHLLTTNIHFIQSEHFFPIIEKDQLVIDALFGTGLNKPLDGITSQLVNHLNNSNTPIISIDIPSGVFCDKSTIGHVAIHATHTLSFQSVKLAFLMSENDKYTGMFHILNIGLNRQFELEEPAVYEAVDEAMIQDIIKPRNKFSHKGNFGHAILIAGSYGMMGAAVLAAKGCLQTGVGKLTCFIPSCGYDIMQSSAPEAMCKVFGETFLSGTIDISAYDVTGIGPGIGLNNETTLLIKDIFHSENKQIVLDADALNILSSDKNLLKKIPSGSVITPHQKEFEKIFGTAANDFDRIHIALKKAADLNIYIILKGHYTAIITPMGKVYFNSTGNAGMAKAGMGDVLTGMITGLMAQQYPLPEATILAVYLHGLAGDLASNKKSQQAMQASDLVTCIADAWKSLTSK